MTDDVSAAGEDLTSDSSDTTSDGPNTRHHLLRHKLSLEEGTSKDKAVAEKEVGKLRSKQRASSKRLSCKHTANISDWSVWPGSTYFALMSDFAFCQADSENDGDESEPEELWMSEGLSQSEDETRGDGPKW